MKTLTNRQVAVLKRTAQNNYPLNQKLAKIAEKISALEEEAEIIKAQINGFEMGVVALTGGFTSKDLIDRVVIPALDADGKQKVDKDGRAMFVTKFVPKEGALVENEYGSYDIVGELKQAPAYPGGATTEVEPENNEED